MMLKRSQAWLANLSEEDIGMSENAQVLDEMLVPVEENRPKEKAKSKSMKTVLVSLVSSTTSPSLLHGCAVLCVFFGLPC